MQSLFQYLLDAQGLVDGTVFRDELDVGGWIICKERASIGAVSSWIWQIKMEMKIRLMLRVSEIPME